MTDQREPVGRRDELAGASWHVSSFSGNANNCLEHGRSTEGMQLVRDTKDREGGVLFFDARAWKSFVNGVKSGEFDAGPA